MSKIKLEDSVLDIVVKMSEGNPGAAMVIAEILQNGGTIDPQSFSGGLVTLMHLDDMGVYGSRIYLLAKDVCQRDITKVIAAVRAVQLGILPSLKLQHAIDNHGDGVDMNLILPQVKERLTQFGDLSV